MSAPPPQSADNHSRYVPGYHYVLFGLLLANLVFAIYTLVVDSSTASFFSTVVAISLILTAYYAREFALGDQNRIIRLEERLRMSRLLPDDLQPKIESLSTKQLVALRFASDGELADLTRKVIADGIEDGKEIKKMIKTWRADHHRI